MSAEERLANDPTSELWGEHRSRYRFAAQIAPRAARKAASQAATVGIAHTVDEASRATALAAPPFEPTSTPPPMAGLRVLDLASGAGFGLRMLREAGACPIGVDYDASALAEVRHIEPGAQLVHGDATCLPLGTASIDVVMSFETLEHVPDPEAMVREIRRVLKPGGTLVLSTPNSAFGPPEHHQNPFHIREFTSAELFTLLSASFPRVQLYGQFPSKDYRYVPFLMIDRHLEPAAIMWKLLARVPYKIRNQLAISLTGRPFYPSELDYQFVEGQCDGAHAIVAVAA